MNEQSANREDTVFRRRFLQSSSLATAAFGMAPLPLTCAMTERNLNPPEESAPLCLWDDRPAKEWMTEALPTAWPTGSVTGLRARGGFEVDLSWKDGRLTDVVIHSKSGRTCQVVYDDKTWDLETTAGMSYPLPVRGK